jgi:predicted GNAT superfamily acetyltransferase
MAIVIRPLKTIEDCGLIVRLVPAIWGEDPSAIVPDHLIITIAKNGGVALLAFDGHEPVGFCLGFAGLTEQLRLKHCSHMTGVLPAYQNRGLGYRLKLAQRERVLAQDIRHITWTFDPLETRNASLNLHKLGAVCRTYLRQVYGQMRDDLNQGLASDRFQVDWWLASHWVRRRIGETDGPPAPALKHWLDRGTPVLNEATLNQQGYLTPSGVPASPRTAYCLLEVPPNFQAIKASDMALAQAWRLQARAMFEEAFRAGYTAIDLLFETGRSCYLLQADWQNQ